MNRREWLLHVGLASLVVGMVSARAARPAERGLGAGLPMKSFRIYKTEGVPGTETVLLVLKKQEPVLEKQFSAKIDCLKRNGIRKTGAEKVTELAAKLKADIDADATFGGNVTIETSLPSGDPGAGYLTGSIADDRPFIFREVHNTPCKDGERHEFDKVITEEDAPQIGLLRLGRRTSSGEVKLVIDEGVQVTVSTAGKSPGVVAAELADLLVRAGREASACQRTLSVSGAFSVTPLVTDPALAFRFGLRSLRDSP